MIFFERVILLIGRLMKRSIGRAHACHASSDPTLQVHTAPHAGPFSRIFLNIFYKILKLWSRFQKFQFNYLIVAAHNEEGLFVAAWVEETLFIAEWAEERLFVDARAEEQLFIAGRDEDHSSLPQCLKRLPGPTTSRK